MRLRTSEAMGRLVGEGADRVARVGPREGGRGERVGSYAARQSLGSLLCLLLVVGEVGVGHMVAGEGELVAVGRGRVAGEQTRGHGEETWACSWSRAALEALGW